MSLQDVFFHSHPEPMWIFDIETLKFLNVNASAIRHYGYSETEFLGMTLADIRPEADLESLKRNLARLSGGRDEAGVWRHIKKNGEQIYVRITSFGMEFDGRSAEMVSATDVTDLVEARAQAQEALEQSQAYREVAEHASAKVQMLLNAVPAKVLVLTTGDYRVIAASDDYLAAVRFSRDFILGNLLSDVFRAEGEGLSDLAKQQVLTSLQRVERTLKTDLMPVQYYPFAGSLDCPRYWSASNTPVLNDAGNLAFIMHKIEDVTDLVLSESVDAEYLPTDYQLPAPHLVPAIVKSNELKLANLHLQEHEANLRTAQYLLGLGIWRMVIEAEGAYTLTWSENTYDIYGIRREDFSHTFDGYGRLVHPDDQKMMFDNYLAFQRSGESILRFEHRVVKADGSVVHVEGIGELTATPKGKVVTGVVRDVTHRVFQNAQMKLLSESIARVNDIVLITEAEPIDAPDGPKIVYANDAFERRTGFRAKDAIGKTPRILQGPLTQRAELDRIREAMSHWRPVRAELINYTKEGEPFWIELDIVPLANEAGWYTHWISIERDISERKQLELARADDAERFEMIMQATHVVIWDWTFEDDRIWWNRNLSLLLGYEDRNLQLSRQYWADHIHAHDRDRVLASLETFRQGQELHWSEDYRLIRLDNSVCWVTDRAIMQRAEDGTPVRMVGSVLDFTERQNLEDRLRQSEKLDSLGQLTGGIAHDFNNLLTVLLGNSETLAARLPAGPLKEMAELSVSACESGAALVVRLLAFARRQPLDPSFADLNDCLTESAVLLRRTLPESIVLQLDLSPDIGIANVDIVQFEAALLNLCLNAKDAMPAGGQLTIETANCGFDGDLMTEVSANRPDDYVMVAVTDSGNGMDAATLAKVFEPFFTTKDSGRGSGLGMSMVYGFVKQSDGFVTIDSVPGAGTRVKLYFPRAREGEAVVDELSREGGSWLPDLKVLVVEDNEFVMAHTKRMLGDLGIQVVTAIAGLEALEKLKENPDVGLLFTDIVLPGGMDGVQIAAAARELRPDIKVLYTTGYADNEIVHQGRLDPDIVLLTKPYMQSDLAAKMIEALGKAAS